MNIQHLTYDFNNKRICELPLSDNCKTIHFNWHHLNFWVYTIEGSRNDFVYINDELNISSYKLLSSTLFKYTTNDNYVYNVCKYSYEYEKNNILTLYKFHLSD
jgi:hypothetical protein